MCEEKKSVSSIIGLEKSSYRFEGTFYYQMLPSSSLNIINKIYMFEIKCSIHHEPSLNIFKLIPISTGSDDFPFKYIEPQAEDILTSMAIFELSAPQLDQEQDTIQQSSSFI